MIGNILQLAWLHLKLTYQSRSALIFGLAMPILFTFVIGAAIQGATGSGDASSQTWRLDVVNQDAGDLGDELLSTLQENPLLDVAVVDAATAQADLDSGDAPATLTLPADLSATLLDGGSLALEFHLNLDDPISGQVVEQAVQAALNQLGSSLEIAATSQRVADRIGLFDPGLAGAPTQGDYQVAAIEAAQARWAAGPPITLQTTQETLREQQAVTIPTGVQQTSPGIAVMFAMFFVVNGTGSIVLEREEGTLKRLLTTPVGRGAIMAGKLLGVFISAVVQFSILVLIGQFAFGVDWGQQPLALAVMVLAFTFSITGMSLLLAALVRTYAQIDAVSTLLIIPLSGLGGAMWPIEIVPAFMQKIALFVPTGWAMRGFHDIITRGLGLSAILPEAGVLTAFGLAFFIIGVWRFRYE